MLLLLDLLTLSIPFFIENPVETITPYYYQAKKQKNSTLLITFYPFFDFLE